MSAQHIPVVRVATLIEIVCWLARFEPGRFVGAGLTDDGQKFRFGLRDRPDDDPFSGLEGAEIAEVQNVGGDRAKIVGDCLGEIELADATNGIAWYEAPILP